MNINNWFKNGCNYNEGVALYASIPQSKPNLVRLFTRKFSTANLDKLKYELSKYKTVATTTSSKKINLQVDLQKTENNQPKPTTKYYRQLKINELPIALHPVYIKQKNDFITACSLKIQLNNLKPEDEEEALKLCIAIEELFDSIELAWKQIDHYLDTKEILEIKVPGFSNLTPAQLLQRRNYKRSTLSKTKTKLKKLSTALPKATTVALTTAINIKINRSKEKIIQLQTDIAKLSELINSN